MVVHGLSIYGVFILTLISSFILPLRSCFILLLPFSLFLWLGNTLELLMQVMDIRSFPFNESSVYMHKIIERYSYLPDDKNNFTSVILMYALLCAIMAIPIGVKQLYLRYIKKSVKKGG